MRHLKFQTNPQAGFVSLFSTIFFMLLITIVTLGFVQIMSVEQQQSLNNELSASAVAAAQSGIEDGKRAVMRYYGLPAGATKNTYHAQMTSPASNNCSSITSSQVGTDLGLSTSGFVVNNAQINQSYSCLTVNLNSPDYISDTSAGKSELISLRAVGGSFQRIKVSWHLLSTTVGTDGDGLPGSPPGTSPYYAAGPLLYPQINPSPTGPSWSRYGYPAYLRVQLYGYPNSGSWTRAELTQRSRSVMLVPAQSGLDENTAINLGTSDPNPGVLNASPTAELQPQSIRCQPAPGANLGSYACTALLELPAGAQFASTANNYFMRITPIYGATHFRVALVNGGSEVGMDEVQPTIDVTGRANDVYRRLQARVTVNHLANFPEFALESANTICKNLQVTNNVVDYRANNCP